jgi:hypothetical protein
LGPRGRRFESCHPDHEKTARSNCSMIIILDRKITPQEFEQAREIYPDYIKTVVDIERNLLAVGGEYHIDCEEVLIQNGSKPENLFGGGFRISTMEIEYMAMSNYKPALGKITYEIMDPMVRSKLKELTEKFLIT